ncbi:BQ5605_C011g06531 [Microbotryum silenes-dioicae]|uniref:BQ5605_C011g06531 protein n=1 Tax=Microbotryum silenes-dioicae TaxID=796604 RepID=A0A2X0LSN4_9BASI|nr:BQ5605_C011g06531 [Microbotryum silenes-dioicae]
MVAELKRPTLVVRRDRPRSSQDGNHPSAIPQPSRPRPKAILKISTFFAISDEMRITAQRACDFEESLFT